MDFNTTSNFTFLPEKLMVWEVPVAPAVTQIVRRKMAVSCMALLVSLVKRTGGLAEKNKNLMAAWLQRVVKSILL
jgi:hypothetical protein